MLHLRNLFSKQQALELQVLCYTYTTCNLQLPNNFGDNLPMRRISPVKWGDFDRFFTFYVNNFFFPPNTSKLQTKSPCLFQKRARKHCVSSLQSYGNIETGILVKVTSHRWGDFDKLIIFS